MKKTISILLMLCMLLPLASHAFAAESYTPEQLEQLKQSADSGNVDAIVTLGNLYYRGNYNSGVSRDFARALSLFLQAAEAGRQEVYMNIASIYEKGSAGSKDLNEAYTWYKKAAEAGIAGAKEKTEEPQFSMFNWRDSVAELSGRLGDYETISNKSIMPFYLDKPVVDCSVILMELSMVEYTGWPFGLYGLYAKGIDGTWSLIDHFSIEKEQAESGSRTYQFVMQTPMSFVALAPVIVEEGMQFTLTHKDVFYVDKKNVGEYSDSVQAPVFNAATAEYPVISSMYYASEYVNPYPMG